MKAYDEGLFRLTDTIGAYIPALKGNPKGRLTFKQLLMHQSGMPSMLSMYTTLIDTASYKDRCFVQDVTAHTGSRLTRTLI